MAEKLQYKYVVIKNEDLELLPKADLVYLNRILDKIHLARARLGKTPTNKYIVCNQDEPYADEVWQIILDGEE